MRGERRGQERQQPRLILGDDAQPLSLVGVKGWTRTPLDIDWRFDERADLEAVVRIEFAPDVASAILAEHSGTVVDYAVNLFWRTF